MPHNRNGHRCTCRHFVGAREGGRITEKGVQALVRGPGPRRAAPQHTHARRRHRARRRNRTRRLRYSSRPRQRTAVVDHDRPVGPYPAGRNPSHLPGNSRYRSSTPRGRAPTHIPPPSERRTQSVSLRSSLHRRSRSTLVTTNAAHSHEGTPTRSSTTSIRFLPMSKTAQTDCSGNFEFLDAEMPECEQ